MKNLMIGLAKAIKGSVDSYLRSGSLRSVTGRSPGGDAQFDIDAVAESAAWSFLHDAAGDSIALYTEDHGLRRTGTNPRYVLVLDPIDGTRPASAGFEMANVSVAAAPMAPDVTMADVDHALLLELSTGKIMYADDGTPGISTVGYDHPIPRLSANKRLEKLFWAFEICGNPIGLISDVYSEIVSVSSNSGGVFVFNSSSYAISRIITGQLDAYVDVANRLLRDRPASMALFRKSGNGNILHLFPYDLAACVYLAERAGVCITDAYGNSLGSTRLLDLTPENQQSVVAASNRDLHQAILDHLDWSA